MGNYKAVSLISVSEKITGEIIPETIYGHVKNKKVIQSKQNVFTKEMSCLINLIAFYNEMTISFPHG